MIDVSNLIFLGSFADLDPTEGNTLSENASALVGQTFTHTGMTILPVSLDHTGDGSITDNGEHGTTREYVTYDKGAGPITTEVDGTITVWATVTTSDKATRSVQITAVQMLNGDLFFAEYLNDGTLDNLQISSIRVDSISGSNFIAFITGQNITNSTIAPIDTTVNGTAGDDVIPVNYVDVNGDSVDGADGVNDRIDSGAGNDNISSGQGNDTVYAGTGDDFLFSDVGDDSLFGGSGNDLFLAGAGNDTVYGESGNDSLYSFTGSDLLYGGDGNDLMDGQADNDTLFGGDGSDTLMGGSGADTLDGGAGDDDIAVGGADRAFGGAGDDVFTLDSGDLGGDVAATIVGGESGEDMSDPANGGAGDVLDLSGSSNAVEIDFGTNSESGTVRGIDADAGVDITFSEIEKVIASGLGDTINGGGATGRINIETGAGRDVVTTGSGNDTVLAGAGNDLIVGNAGDDSISGEDGDDDIFGGFGNDTLYGGAGDDNIVGDEPSENGDDLIYGGAGNDTLIGNVGADTLYGGDGDDFFYGGFLGQAGADVIDGGQGIDTVSYEFSIGGVNVNLSTGLGSGGDAAGDSFSSIEVVLGSDFADSLTGGAANETLSGGMGSDTIAGGEGADYLDGGDGDDDIVIGSGDQAFGGAGDDVFTINTALSGNANLTVSGGETGEDATDPANGSAGDILDLRGGTDVRVFYNQLDPTWNGLTSESGTATFLNSAGQTVTVQFSQIEQVIVCFAAGTMIDTAEGEKPIEALQVGDLVRTADHDYQPIRWIGSSKVEAKGNLAPILIKAGALGNTRDLKVSPQHRMLLGGWQAEMLFGDDEVLVAAKHLVNDSTILRATGGEVEYFHMLFDTHEIVFAEGAPSESFHPGEVGWGALAEEARAEILALFPELQHGDFSAYGTSARRTLKASEARVLCAYA